MDYHGASQPVVAQFALYCNPRVSLPILGYSSQRMYIRAMNEVNALDLIGLEVFSGTYIHNRIDR